jgi:hypothetical protein
MREFDILDDQFAMCLKDECLYVLKKAKMLFLSKVDMGRKVSRTNYVLKAFGRFYPRNVYDYSFLVDQFTGVCDDLNDEQQMNKEEKELWIGFLAETIWEMMDLLTEESLGEISSHIKRLLYIQIAEKHTTANMAKASTVHEKIRQAILHYRIRCIDMDTFVILPSRYLGLKKMDIDVFICAARLFRMVDLYAKDLEDREHDLENETSTPVTVLFQDGMNPDVLREPIWKYIKRGFEEIRPEGTGEIERHVVESFYQMAEERYRVIRGKKGRRRGVNCSPA